MTRLRKCLYLLLIITGTLSAAEDEKEVLQYERENWTIGISKLSDKGISGSSSYLLNSLPLLLYNEISEITEHRLSSSEQKYYSETYLREKLHELENEKTDLHSQRDELLFSDDTRRERQKQYRDLSRRIDEKKEEIILFKERQVDEVQITENMTVIFKQLESDNEMVLELPRDWAAHYMKHEDLDFFITGGLEQIEDLFFLSLKAYGRGEEEPLISLEKTVIEEDLEGLIQEAGKDLRSLILGRTWAGVNIETLPRTAVIKIDGSTVGVGSVRLKSLEPGFVTLTVSENGYITDNRQVYLAAEGSRDLSITLEEGEESSLYLFSDPPGADVYFGALWMGQTPLFTGIPEERMQIKLSKDEYMPFFISSDKLSGESLTVRLGTDLYEKEMALKDAKSAFYRSLGWFSLSVGVPIVMAGIYQNLDNRYINYAYSYSQTGNSDYYEKALDYKRQADVAYMVYWGGFALSGSLLVNVFFKLWNYIKAAEESTED